MFESLHELQNLMRHSAPSTTAGELRSQRVGSKMAPALGRTGTAADIAVALQIPPTFRFGFSGGPVEGVIDDFTPEKWEK